MWSRAAAGRGVDSFTITATSMSTYPYSHTRATYERCVATIAVCGLARTRPQFDLRHIPGRRLLSSRPGPGCRAFSPGGQHPSTWRNFAPLGRVQGAGASIRPGRQSRRPVAGVHLRLLSLTASPTINMYLQLTTNVLTQVRSRAASLARFGRAGIPLDTFTDQAASWIGRDQPYSLTDTDRRPALDTGTTRPCCVAM